MFWFPRTRFVDDNSIAGQMLHIGSELDEFKQELAAKDMRAAMIELLDLRNSVETAFRILQEKYGASPELTALPVYRVHGMGPDEYLKEVIACYRMFADAVLSHEVPVIVLKLLWLLQAVDTEIELMLVWGLFSRETYVELVRQKNAERSYYKKAV